MYKQDKAIMERNAKILREMVKRPENKVCADCKRNDARWASWNIGVFVCIRCSGIHRGMGTHISKVKSVDLDKWNDEQMESIQRWGNHRANLYWEAHLRPGHTPPEHKMESFIRSKYESRRWAREGPPPSDPSILESGTNDGGVPQIAEVNNAPPPPAVIDTPRPMSPPRTTRQPQAHQLLSASTVGRSAVATPRVTPTQSQQAPAPAPAPPAPTPQNDLFSLDFHTPPPQTNNASNFGGAPEAPAKDKKHDILSLFSAPAATATSVPSAGFGQFISPQLQRPVADPFGGWAQAQAQPQAAQPVSMMGSGGTGMWGVQSGWTPPAAQAPHAQASLWGGFSSAPAALPPANNTQNGSSNQAFFDTSNVWGATGGAAVGTAGANDLFSTPFPSTSTTSTQKKDDVFGDLWGDFK